MEKILRVLFVLTLERDAAFLLDLLDQAGYLPMSWRVDSKFGMESAIYKQDWDLVISEQNLQRFDARSALDLVKRSGKNIPFITVGDALDGEMVLTLVKRGSDEFTMKDNFFQLVAVVEREVSEARQKKESIGLLNLDLHGDANYQLMFESFPIAMLVLDLSEVKGFLSELTRQGVTDVDAYFSSNPQSISKCASLVHVRDGNRAALKLFGAGSKPDLVNRLEIKIPHPALINFLTAQPINPELNGSQDIETIQSTVEHQRIDVKLSLVLMSGHEVDFSQVVLFVQDISHRLKTQSHGRLAENQLRSMVEQIPAIVYTQKADESGTILFMSPQVEALSGYPASCWVDDKNFWKKIIHLDDYDRYLQANELSDQTGEPMRLEFRMYTKDQRILWVREEAVLIHDANHAPLLWQGVIHDISDAKTVEAELLESQRRMSQLMSNLPGMAIRCKLDPDWNLEFASEGCLQLTGYNAEELTAGAGLVFGALIHPDDREMVRTQIRKSIQQHERFELTYRILTNFGQEKWVWEKGQAIFDPQGKPIAMEGFLEDITAQIKSDIAIKQNLSEMEVLHQISQAINHLMPPDQIINTVLTILDGRLNWHYLYIRLYDHETGKVDLLGLRYPGQTAELDESKKAILTELIPNSSTGLCGWVYRNGQSVLCKRLKDDERYVETHPQALSGMVVPLVTGERNIGSMGVESDRENAFNEQDLRLLTTIANQTAAAIENSQLFIQVEDELHAREMAEEKLLEIQTGLEQRVISRTAELEAANLSLENSGRLKDEFLASMSHEMRTPLTGILGLSEVLQLQTFGELSDRQLTALKNIENSGRHLLELINDILDISKIEASQLKLRKSPCDLDMVCGSVIKSYEKQAMKKNQDISIVSHPAGMVVQADAPRLRQMLGNLLSNAIKFTADGGKIGIELKGCEDTHSAQICVSDNGIGIREEDLPHLFQIFKQLDGRLERHYNGTGLGLALVRKLAELHGGSAEVESTYGVGSRFTISLPWN